MNIFSRRENHADSAKSVDPYTKEIENNDRVVINNLSTGAIEAVGNAGIFRKTNLLFKRLFDVFFSSAALVILSPLFVSVFFLIKRETPGPAIFEQERWGIGQRKIRIYKFRTMYIDKDDASGVVQTISGDSRITKLGKTLRRTNLDELPQLVNVLKGDMSLIGPRCHPVGMFAVGVLYEDLVPQYHIRHLMRPGMTGLAQSKGLRGPTIDRELALKRIKNDLQYIANFNFFSDIKIIVRTVRREFLGGTGS